MNDDKTFGNMAEEDFRALQEAPLTKNDAADPQTGSDISEDLQNVLANDIDADIENADLDDPIENGETLTFTPEDEDDVPAGGFREILESDLDEPLSDGGLSRDHIHSPDMDAPDTPGEIDIEDLEEGDLEGTGIPSDALLDPLEE
jgi:hypothetical protein